MGLLMENGCSLAQTALLIHGSAGGYGADRQLLLLATVLDRSRFRPLVVLPERGELADQVERLGVEVHIEPLAVLKRGLLRGRALPRTLSLLRHNVRSLTALARRQDAAIVHSNMSLILCGQAVADRAGVPHVVSVREIYAGTGGRAGAAVWPLLRRRLLRADALACVSAATAAQFDGSSRALVLHDGLPRELDLPARAQARERLGLDPDAFVAGVVGRISDWKGQDVFVRALAERPLAEVEAVGLVAGDAAGGQEHFERNLDTLSTGLALNGRVRMLGFRNDVDTVLAAVDAVVVPSRFHDPLPNVALEGAAAGLPVVCTSTGGQREIVKDGVTGRVVAPGDHRALAAALRQLADEPEAARRMGEAAAADVRERFDRERLASDLQELYARLLRPAAAAAARRRAPWARPHRARRPELVSVIVCVRNEERHVAHQLAALSAQTYEGAWELLVVDNGSTDGTVGVVEDWRDRLPRLRIVDATAQAGLNYARNCGAEAATGDLLAFADGDDEVVEGWLEGLVTAAEAADLVGGPLDSEPYRGQLPEEWIPTRRGAGLPVGYGFLPYVPGGNCAVWADVAQDLRWNEDYLLGGCDAEFAFRVGLAGGTVAFAPEAVLRRRPPTSLADLAGKYFRYGVAAPKVYRDFRAAGMPPPDVREAAALWWFLLRNAHRAVLSHSFRGRWVRVGAGRLGRLVGSVRQRTLYL